MKLKISKNATAAIYLVVFGLLMAFLTLVGFSDSVPEAVFFIYLLGMVLFLVLVSNNTLKTSNDKIIFWGAFVIKIAYVLYRYPLTKLASPTLTGDARRFWRTAVEYYQGNFRRVYTPFPYVLNFEFHIFGKNILCCCLTNIVFSMLMVVLVVRIMNKYDIYGAGRFWAVGISAFLIWGIVAASSIWREAIYFAFITWSFAEYISFIYTKRARNLFAAIVLMIPVLILHVGYFPIVAVYLFDFFRHEKLKSRGDLVNRLLIIAMFVLLVVGASRINNIGSNYITVGLRFIDRLSEGETGSVGYYDEAGSRYLYSLVITSVPTLILYSPIRLFFFLFSPLPTNWRGITDIATFFLDSAVHMLFFWLSIKGAGMLKKHEAHFEIGEPAKVARALKVGLWAVLLCGFVFGLRTSTAGTAIRHRDVLLGIEAIQIGIGLYLLKGNHGTIFKRY